MQIATLVFSATAAAFSIGGFVVMIKAAKELDSAKTQFEDVKEKIHPAAKALQDAFSQMKL